MEKKVKVNVKRGDTVVVIAGKDKGKKGKVLFVFPEDNTCIVDGVNVMVKHKKARTAQQKSAREKKAGKIDISNVQILCKCGKATRVSHKIVGGKSIRWCTKCDETLDKKYVKAAKEKAKEADEVEKDKDETTVRKPLQRREVKVAADSKVKKPMKTDVSSQRSMPRKTGGG